MTNNYQGKTTRICFKRCVIYCSYKIIRDLKTLRDPAIIIQLNNKWFPAKGKTQDVVAALKRYIEISPDEFTPTSRLVIKEMSILGTHATA